MTTPLEDRITAALDQMARAAVPDENVGDQDGVLFQRRGGAGERRRMGVSRRGLAIAASVVLIVVGVVAIAARLDRSGNAPNVEVPPAPTPPSVNPSDEVAPFVAIVDPAVAGMTPTRDNHLSDWVNDGNDTGLFYAYRAKRGGFDVVSWQGYADVLWSSPGKDYPVDDQLDGIGGLDARRETADDKTRLALVRSNGTAARDGLYVTIPESEQRALRDWLESAADETAAKGIAAAHSLPAPDGYTLVTQVGRPVSVLYYPDASEDDVYQPSTVVQTWTFTGPVDPQAWLAVNGLVYPTSEPLEVASGKAWRLNSGDLSRMTVIWQPNDNTIVKLEAEADADSFVQGLTLVPRDSDVVVESRFFSGPPSLNQPSEQVSSDEIRATTPIGRFGYRDNGLCEILVYSGGWSGRCDDGTPAGKTVGTHMCVVATVWVQFGGSRVYAFVDAAAADTIEIRRSANDSNPVTPEVFTGESNGREWALVTAQFDDPSWSSNPDVRFTGGPCQPGEMSESAASSVDTSPVDGSAGGVVSGVSSSDSDPLSPVAIGDEVMLAMKPLLTDRGYRVDAVANRQLSDTIEPLRQMVAKGLVGDPLVIELGTNGPFTEQEYQSLLSVLSEVPNVVVLTMHGDRPWIPENNRIIAANNRPDDNVIVLDWDGLAADCPGDCFAADGIHLTDAGAQYLADQIQNLTGW